MADYSTYGLIDRPSSLLGIPLASSQIRQLASLLQVFFLQNHNRVCHLRIRYADQDNASSRIIRKVQAFRNPAPADPKQQRSFRLLLKDSLVV